VWPIYR